MFRKRLIRRIYTNNGSLPMTGSVRYMNCKFYYDETEIERQCIKKEAELKRTFEVYQSVVKKS